MKCFEVRYEYEWKVDRGREAGRGGGGGEIERLILGKYGVRERMAQNELRQRYNERERHHW